MSQFVHHYLHLLGESLPLFVVGAAVGAAVETWLPRAWIERWLATGKSSVFLAAVAGSLLPGCAMTTMPLAASLRRRGVNAGTVAAFIMIAPILSPHTVAMTAALISPQMALARVVLAFLAACTLGFLLQAIGDAAWLRLPPAVDVEPVKKSADCCSGEKTSEPPPVVHSACCSAKKSCCDSSQPPVKAEGDCCSKSATHSARGLLAWWRTLLGNLRELAPYLLIGLLIAAALLTWFPVEKYSEQLRGGWQAYTGVTLLAIPAYVCDGGEIPLTRALLALGVGAGPAFCFMLASVGTCFATIAMSAKIIGARATAIYLAAWIVLAIGGGLLVGAWLG